MHYITMGLHIASRLDGKDPQATTSAPNLAFRYRPPGVPPKTLDAALQGEFIELR